MAASAPRPAPESRGQKRQLELLNEDAKKLCATDIRTPFRSLQDAVDRLLPFHLLGGLESDAADLEELQEQPHPELIATRNQLAAQQVQVGAMEAMRRVEAARQRTDMAMNRHSQPQSPDAPSVLPEDRYIIARALLQEAREQLERERRKPLGYMTPEREEEAEADAADAAEREAAAQREQAAADGAAAAAAGGDAGAAGARDAGGAEPTTASGAAGATEITEADGETADRSEREGTVELTNQEGPSEAMDDENLTTGGLQGETEEGEGEQPPDEGQEPDEWGEGEEMAGEGEDMAGEGEEMVGEGEEYLGEGEEGVGVDEGEYGEGEGEGELDEGQYGEGDEGQYEDGGEGEEGDGGEGYMEDVELSDEEGAGVDENGGQ